MRTKKFCWIPTPVYKIKYFRAGFKWLTCGWVDDDGCMYVDKDELVIDFDELAKRDAFK